MNLSLPLLFMTAFSSAALLAGSAHFDGMKPGSPPTGWLATQTGGGQAKWSVEAEDSAPTKPNVLKQSGEATFPVCIKQDVNLENGFVGVKFKPIAGKEDQAGGLIWRVKDQDNYYVARANAIEDNVTIYHTLQGKRVSFKNVNVKVAGNQWHTLRVEFTGIHFIVIFNGKKVIEADDHSITGPGAVGVWTKADSVTLFDDFNYGKK